MTKEQELEQTRRVLNLYTNDYLDEFASAYPNEQELQQIILEIKDSRKV
jgi:hypothetical protein